MAAFGMIGLESCLGATLNVLVEEESLDLMTVIKALTVNPREIMGFESDIFADKTPAELTIFDPKESWEFSKNDIFSKSCNSPFVGRKLTGRVKYTIVKNQIALI